jgi:hypothetical protein
MADSYVVVLGFVLNFFVLKCDSYNLWNIFQLGFYLIKYKGIYYLCSIVHLPLINFLDNRFVSAVIEINFNSRFETTSRESAYWEWVCF